MIAIEYAYRRFLRVRFPLPTEHQLADVEQRINVVFPEDYRRFILEFNGGYFDEPVITPAGEGYATSTAEEASQGVQRGGKEHPLQELAQNVELVS